MMIFMLSYCTILFLELSLCLEPELILYDRNFLTVFSLLFDAEDAEDWRGFTRFSYRILMSCNCQWFFIFTYRLKILLCSFCFRVSPINFNGLWRFEGFLFWLCVSLKLRVNSYLSRCFFNYLLDWFCLFIIIDIEYFFGNFFFQQIFIALFDFVRRLF